jgi:hypothetical protein
MNRLWVYLKGFKCNLNTNFGISVPKQEKKQDYQIKKRTERK